jgi:hypothetical protein
LDFDFNYAFQTTSNTQNNSNKNFDFDYDALDDLVNAESELFYFCVQTSPQSGRRSRFIDPILNSLITKSKIEITEINSFQVIPNGIVLSTSSKNKFYEFCSENSKINVLTNSKVVTFYVTKTTRNPSGLFNIPKLPDPPPTPLIQPSPQAQLSQPTPLISPTLPKATTPPTQPAPSTSSTILIPTPTTAPTHHQHQHQPHYFNPIINPTLTSTPTPTVESPPPTNKPTPPPPPDPPHNLPSFNIQPTQPNSTPFNTTQLTLNVPNTIIT